MILVKNKPKKDYKITTNKKLIICFYGKHTVFSALKKNSFVVVKNLFLLKNKLKDYENLVRSREIKNNLTLLNKDEFVKKFKQIKNHQGIVAYGSYVFFDFNDLKQEKFQKNSFFLALENVFDQHNFGAIIRTAYAFGVDGIIILSKEQVPVTSTTAKTSSGALFQMKIYRVGSFTKTFSFLKKSKFKVITSTINSEKKSSLEDLKVNLERVVLVLGNEEQGVTEKLYNIADINILIDLKNNFNSLNVSVAAAILMSAILAKSRNKIKIFSNLI